MPSSAPGSSSRQTSHVLSPSTRLVASVTAGWLSGPCARGSSGLPSPVCSAPRAISAGFLRTRRLSGHQDSRGPEGGTEHISMPASTLGHAALCPWSPGAPWGGQAPGLRRRWPAPCLRRDRCACGWESAPSPEGGETAGWDRVIISLFGKTTTFKK